MDKRTKFVLDEEEIPKQWYNIQAIYLRPIYIRYFPVKNEKGNHLGCLKLASTLLV